MKKTRYTAFISTDTENQTVIAEIESAVSALQTKIEQISESNECEITCEIRAIHRAKRTFVNE